MEKVALAAALERIDETWSPRIVARYNGNKVFLARARGIDLPNGSVEPEGTPPTGDPATAAPEVEL